VKRISRAQAQRLAAERRSAQEMPDPLDPVLRSKLDVYRPLQLDAATWDRIRPIHRDVMTRSKITGESSFTGRCVDLAAYLAWRADMDLSIAAGDAMTFAAIDDYHRRGTRDGINDSSWDNRHSRLRNLARKVNPGIDAPVPAATVGYRAVKAPYMLGESLAIRRLADRQRKPVIRRQLCAIVGLCEGAGLAPADLRGLHGRHICDLGDGGICVDVPGPNARTVWVRRTHEGLVRIGIDGVRPNQLVIGTAKGRRNVTTSVIDSAELYGDDIPEIEATRLRSTWLTWLLTRPIDLRTAMRAAGLTTARTLQELLPYVEGTPDTPDSLRDGSVVVSDGDGDD
jgi:hypothetical protein